MRSGARRGEERGAWCAAAVVCVLTGCAATVAGERANGDAAAPRDASGGDVAIERDVGVSCADDVPSGPPRVARIAAGIAGTCAVMSDRTVRCWGFLPSVTDAGALIELRRATPIEGLRGVVQIALGETHACVVTCGGRVRCWGENSGGQLGDGTRTARATPVEVPLPLAAVEVVASRWHSCARLTDGTLHCWGYAISAVLAGADASRGLRPIAVAGLDGVTLVRLTAIGTTNGAVRSDGSLWRWGVATSWDPARAAPRPARFDTSLVRAPVVAFVGNFVEGVCVLDANGATRCWAGEGADLFSLPAPLTAMRVAEIESSDEHLCGRGVDGSVWCASRPGQGWRSFGQGPPPPDHTFARGPVLGIRDAVQLAVGELHACALLAGGEVRCWGVGGYAGDGTRDTAYTPVTVRGLD
jgi:Regulator of chromosome condensation (RCC1) repeat